VADKRALTPSEAAELVVPNRDEIRESLVGAENRLKELLLSRMQTARQKFQDLSQRRAFRLPLERIRDLERRTDDWADRLHRAARQRLLFSQKQAEAAAARLEGLSPLNVLARGYSLTRNEAGKVIRNAAQVQPGDRLETLVHQGKIVSRVEEVG
jgi:exodeoxyribonuclease VII large subunit